MQNTIVIKGARQHNLKNLDLEIPRDQLVVMTGLSGSGKSSLAFDTIYAEGQRRYVESLSAYARQFLEQMTKPDVDSIDGLSPAISIEQKTTSHNPRSTVGTVTEIYDYFRLLFARIGHPFCYQCGNAIAAQTIQQMVDAILGLPVGSKIQILAPIVRGRKGEYRKELLVARKAGFVRARIDGVIRDLGESISLHKQRKHTIEIVIDRVVVKHDTSVARRLADSVETALKMTQGLVGALTEEEHTQLNELPLRRDTVSLLTYLRDHRVTGTQSTGNLPLKAIREVTPYFVHPPALETNIGDRVYKIRSEYDLWPLYFIHTLLEVGGLLTGGPGRKMLLTSKGVQFLEAAPATQVWFMLETWWHHTNWLIAYPFAGIGERLPYDFALDVLDHLLALPIEKP